jgi:hypothetical protein
MADTKTKALFNPKTAIITAVSVALGLLIFHMVKKHVLSQMGA